jgi:hypothetical protein
MILLTANAFVAGFKLLEQVSKKLKATGDNMKKLILPLLIFSLCIFIFAVNVRAATVATPGGDFIDMYKAFFRDMQANHHQQVWDSLTAGSKNAIAKSLQDAALDSNERIGQAGVLDMLDKNSSNIRDDYLKKLNDGFEKISFYNKALKGKYAVKSSAKERIVLTISVNKAPKDFQILLEDGRWKINFFDDMMR